jgi:hypothetical protein
LTAQDIFLEMALLEAGLSFSRIIQDGPNQRFVINRYWNVTRDEDDAICVRDSAVGDARDDNQNQALCASANDKAALRRVVLEAGFMEVPFPSKGEEADTGIIRKIPLVRELPAPILYKYYGSEDITNSCIIAVAQMLRLQKAISMIPAEMHEIIGNTSSLFLGYHFADIEFIQSAEMLSSRLSRRDDILVQFALVERPDASRNGNERMDAGVWNALLQRMRLNINLLEGSPITFLDVFANKIRIAGSQK